MPALVRTTGAVPVVVYRHPGAVLSSYRRMGWTADVSEIRTLQARAQDPAPVDDVQAMMEFWTYLHEQVLAWLPQVPDALLVSHAELTSAGAAGTAALLQRVLACREAQGRHRHPWDRPTRRRSRVASTSSTGVRRRSPTGGGPA